MARKSLPVRTEFGFKRTECDCQQCKTPCEFVPGYLVPSDIGRLKAHLELEAGQRTTLEEFAKRWLLASPGAVVAKDGRVFRIPTLVPRRQKDNTTCIFFSGKGQCLIWPAAPYGCAFFDYHQDMAEGAPHVGLESVYKDMQADGPYHRLWKHLNQRGLVAPGPEECWAKMREASEIRKAGL